MTVDPTDNLIVQRGSTLGKIEVQNMATIQNNDLLIVGRGSDSFKITGQDFKNSLAGGVDLQGSAVVAPTVADIGDTLTCTASAAGGTTPYTFDYQWFCQLDGTVDWVEHPGSNTDTVVLDAGDVDYRFRCHVTVTGANGGTLNLISNETGVIGDPALAPEIGSVSLVEQNPDADPRFTSQEFVASVSMTEDGVPVSTKKIDAYVEGEITTQVQFEEPLESSSATTFYSNQRQTNVYEDIGTFENVALYGIDGNTNTRWFATTKNADDSTIEVDITNPVTCSTGTVHVLMSPSQAGNTALELLINGTGYVMDIPVSTIWDGSFMQGPNVLVPVSVNIPAGTVITSLGVKGKGNAHPNFFCIDLNGNPNPVLASDFKWLSLTSNVMTNLQFAAGTDMTTLAAGDTVEQGATNGTVGSITDTTVTLSSSSGTWIDGNNVTGPEKTIVGDNAKKYLKFDSNGNVTDLLNAPQDPAYETTDADPTLTLKFPATFPSGNTPDDELGEGTKLVVEATATNSAGTSGPVTAEVQPEGAGAPPLNLNALTSLWAGNGVTGRDIVNGIDLVNHDGLVWIKDRTYDGWHQLYDTLRGPALSLVTNNNDAQSPLQINKLDAFNEDGFELGNHTYVNGNSYNYVGWTFQKAAGYFDVVKYTGNGATQEIPHSLGTKPGLMIIKGLTTNFDWFVYSSATGATQWLNLNNTNSANTSNNIWNSTEPTDTHFYVGVAGGVNTDGVEHIAYLFAEDTPDLIKCGSYTGTGTDNPVDVGFEPQWLLVKGTQSSNGGWCLLDNKRGDDLILQAEGTQADQAADLFDFTANGFTAKTTNISSNNSGETYVYVAIAAPTTRSMTQAEYDTQSLRFATYDNRKEVYEGQQAQSQRSNLAAQLIAEGYDQAAVDLMLDIN